MDVEIQPTIPDHADNWKGFSAFIHQFYSSEMKQEFAHSFPHNLNLHQTPSPFSLLLTVGGQASILLLHQSGMSSDDILQFKTTLSKVEELCLLTLILDYEKYKQVLAKSKQEDVMLNGLGVTNVVNPEQNDISHPDVSCVTKGVASVSKLPALMPDVCIDSQLVLTASKKEECSGLDIRGEHTTPEIGVMNEKPCTTDQSPKSSNYNSLSSKNTNFLMSSTNGDKEQSLRAKQNDEDLQVVRKSSRQIRVSSKYAENKDAIQNLLKPLVITTKAPATTSKPEPPCLCSVCKKSFQDPKSLLNHWRRHGKINEDKANLPFQCQLCDNKCVDYTELKDHFQIHQKSTKKVRKKRKLNGNIVQSATTNSDKSTYKTGVKTQIDDTEEHESQPLAGDAEIESTCAPCNQDFPDKESFESHKLSCRGDGFNPQNSKTKECSKIFENKASLMSNQNIQSENGSSANLQRIAANKVKRSYRRVGIYKCKLCTCSFQYERQLDLHMTVHTGEKPHSCEICGRGFRLKHSLLNHMITHDETARIKCEFCPKSFFDRKAFEHHQLIHSGVKPYSCEVCGKGFRRLLGFKNHQRLHKKEEAIKCDQCNKTFVDKWGMLKHKTIHSGEKPFMCSHCGKGFRLKKGLTDHVKLHDKDTQLQCNLCPRTFIEKRKLDIHMMAHKGEKPFICDKCGKGFMHSMNLKVHNRCHTGEKPYKCSFCERTFNQQGSLSAHERLHKGERPYVCDICGDGYITKSQLTVHKRKHTNERPYKCDQCDYAAYTSNLLKVHKVKHSDEKPYKCQVCPSAFKRQHHLDAHTKTHLTNVVKEEEEATEIVDIVIHKCPYCSQCFGSHENLTAHIDQHEIVVVTETAATKTNEHVFIDQGPNEVAYNIVLI